MMERERISRSNGSPATGRSDTHALGDVARDMIDHVSMIVRDRFKIGRLEARRYVDHVKHEVAPRAGVLATAVVFGGIAALCGLLAIFIGIASAIGVAWTFAIFCTVFLVLAIGTLGFYGRMPLERDEGAEIARRFPAARTHETRPVHDLVAQRETPERHTAELFEAARETQPANDQPERRTEIVEIVQRSR